MRISLIAALDRKFAIGRDNALPWHLPADLQRFKRLTVGKPILMGRKTAESLGRALPGRQNLVLTRSRAVPFAGMQPVACIDEAIAEARVDADAAGTLFVIGGADVFRLTLPLATALHLTWVDTVIADADVFFPPLDWSQWRVVDREPHAADARHAFDYAFVDYAR